MFMSGVAAPHAASHQPTGSDALYVIGATVDNPGTEPHTDISGNPVKQKETKLNAIPANSTLTITHEARRVSGAANSYSRIYRNGSYVGTSHMRNVASWGTFEEDIAGWNSGDLLQVYCTHSSGSGATATEVRNLAAVFKDSQGIAPTNQDP